MNIHIRLGHFNKHSLRKGLTTHAVSKIINLPPITSILYRRE